MESDLSLSSETTVSGKSSDEELPFLPEWVALWAPQLAFALTSGSASERKHVSTRCIPLLIQIVGGPTRRHDATYAYSFLLEEVRSQRDNVIGKQVESYAGDTETLSDRILWATYEVSIDSALVS